MKRSAPQYLKMPVDVVLFLNEKGLSNRKNYIAETVDFSKTE